jgi:thiamine monophosphate synthase
VQASPTLAAAYSISKAVRIPVMCASGISAVTAPMACAAGAAGVVCTVSLSCSFFAKMHQNYWTRFGLKIHHKVMN